MGKLTLFRFWVLFLDEHQLSLRQENFCHRLVGRWLQKLVFPTQLAVHRNIVLHFHDNPIPGNYFQSPALGCRCYYPCLSLFPLMDRVN